MKHTPQIGTVSHGTLLSRDLIPAFAGELEWLSGTDRTTEESALLVEAGDAAALLYEAGPDALDEEQAGELVDELINALEKHAPEGAYFGAHWGDGSDFGFWPLEEENV